MEESMQERDIDLCLERPDRPERSDVGERTCRG